MGSTSTVVLGLVAALAGAGVVYGQAVNLGGTNNIVVDGRTQTHVTVNGTNTKITTNTVSNGTGFNSFSDFQQAAGTRVDLYVPDGAGNLLNIVRNSRVVIDGTLNSYLNGEIGGNIFFAAPNGFVVGANGSVNVGSLTVNTPTKQFLEGVIRADGSVDSDLATQVMRGVIPISPDGVISIAGIINAKGGVSLQGREVSVTGGNVQLDGADIDQLAMFGSTVNQSGLAQGGAIVAHGGSISIVATDKARIGGRLDASAKTSGKGGHIAVRSGGDITIDGVARLTADGAGVEGGGGVIDVIAADRLLVEDGAFFGAHATGAARGGFVELSGKVVNLGAIGLDLRSEHGKAGSLLIDPIDLIIDAGSVGVVTGGADVTLLADNSITVAAGGFIDTRNITGGVSVGDSGDITIRAPLITIADGAHLRADVTSGSGFAGGDILLDAAATGGLLDSTATARIVIGTGGGAAPVLMGRNITLQAAAVVNGGLGLFDVPTAKASVAVNTATIVASGAFTAEANATTESGVDVLPVGVVVTDVEAAVAIGGNASISAASATLAANASVTSNITTQSLVPESAMADGAVAVSTITSKAIVDVAGTATLAIDGALALAARNDVVSTLDATPNAAQFGASVAVSVMDVTTTARIGGAAQVSAGSIGVDAATSTAVTLKAAAAAGGAEEPQDGSTAKSYLDDDKYAEGTSTSEGSVSVVGGLAIADLTSTTLAEISSTGTVEATGAVAVTSTSANSADVTADGSAVDSSVGVGVAVGINLAHVANSAIVSQAVEAGALTITASNGAGANSFTTSATSGAGASNVGVAGSLATNLIDTESLARLGSGVTTITGGGAVSLLAVNTTTSTASAQPAEDGASGDTVGVGVSAAINIVANRATAEIADGAGLSGAGAVSLASVGTFTTETETKAGSEGGISITPALALSLVNNATTARLGSGTTLSAGSVELSAAQFASTATNASAAAAGGNVALGAALALAIVNDQVSVTTARNITTTGGITLAALGASASTLTAEASAAGAKAADDAGKADGEKDVDGKVDDQLASAKGKQTNAGIGNSAQQQKTGADVDNKDQRSASTSEGKVSVAAAVGVNVQSASVSAIVPDAVAISAGGTLTLRSIANADGSIDANGSAVGGAGVSPSKVGIGAAVAVNKVDSRNIAQLGTATHTVGGLSIEALKRDAQLYVADPSSTVDRADKFEAAAAAGAGGSKVGIAGSLALNLIDTESTARIAAGAVVNLTGGGAVSLSADNRSEVIAKALPVGTGATGGTVGVGVSAAINIIANRSTAELADNVTLAGASALALSANGVFSAEAEAKAGAAGGVSITPALALSMISSTTTAKLGLGTTLSAGSVSLAAVQQSSVTTTASAKAAGDKAAIGAALALALVNDDVIATTGRNVTATGAVSFVAQGKSVGTLTVEASASGAKAADDDGKASGEKDVDGKVDDQLKTGKDKQASAGVGDAGQQQKTGNDVDNGGAKRSAKTSEGKVSVAAAVGVNVTTSNVTAVVPDGVAISAGGVLTLASANTTSGSVTSDGTASGAQVGIGVAVSVNVIDKTNTALLGNGAHQANGVSVSATQFGDSAAPDVDVYETKATSGAGGSKVGIAGSLALNLINAQTSARIATGASVNAGTGASVILADQRMTATASALPSGKGAVGGKVGVGASVALNLITDTTTAMLEDGATITGGGGLAVTANSQLSTTTEAAAGSAGGVAIDAVVALAMLDQTTTARIGTGAGLVMTGAVSIGATSGGAHEATADGDTKATNVAVGAAAAVIIGGGTQNGALANTSVTSATLARNVTATALEIAAASDRTYVAEASATAKGGKEDTATKDASGKTSSSDTLDKTKDSQKGTDAAEQQSAGNTESSGSGGGSGGSKVTVAAAVGVAAAQDVVRATLGAVTVTTTGAVSVTASNTVGMATGGIGAALDSKSEVGVGIGVALGIINNTTTAEIADAARITQSGSVAVTATSAENTSTAFADRITARAVAGASSSKVSVAGALAVGISTSSARASIGANAVVTSTGNIVAAVDNTSRLSARSLAGAYTSGSVGIGASIATIYSDHTLTASVGPNAQLTGKDVAVTATNHKVSADPSFIFSFDLDKLKDQALNGTLLGSANYYAEAMGGAAATGGSGVAVQGSFAVMVFSDDVTASVGTNATIAATGAVTLAAESDLLAKALAGGVAAGSNVGVGVSATVIVSEGIARSLLGEGASVTQSTSFTTRASASQDVQAFGVAAAAGSTAGVAGVASVVVSRNTVEALLAKSTAVASSGAATIGASNDFTSFVLATGVGLGSTAGVGAAASVVTVNNVTRAALASGTRVGDAVSINAGAVAIAAAATQKGKTITAAGGAGVTAGVGAGAAVYVLGTVTEALVGDYAQIGQGAAPATLAITATDSTDLDTIAGSLGVGGTAGVGAGAAVGVVAKTVTAAIGSNATISAGNVRVAATSAETALTTAIGFGVGGTAGLAGAISVYSVNNTTTAQIGADATVWASNNVAVLATDDVAIDFISGAVGGGGTAGVGAAASVALVNTTTAALIAGGASVTALGNGTALDYVIGYSPVLGGGSGDYAAPLPDEYAYAAGADSEVLSAAEARAQGLRLLALTRDATPVTASGNGVVVNASGDTSVRSLAVGAGIGGTAGVSISANVPVITTTLTAGIGNGARINVDNNAGAGANQSVVVAAAGDIYRIGLAGSVGGGTVGIGGGVDTAIISPTITATIGSATVAAKRDVIVSARGRADLVGAAAAAGIGATVGIAGGVSVFALDSNVSALIGGNASVDAEGNVAVVAEDITRTSMVAGSLSVGVAGAGIGAAVGVSLITKHTVASIAANAAVTARGNGAQMLVPAGTDFSTTRNARGVLVYANSNESVFTLGIAGAGGLYAGVAGAITLNLLDVSTLASIGQNASINAANTGANAAQDVVVVARDSTAVAAIDGGLAIGAGAIAGAVDIGVLRNTTAASIGDGATITARGRVDVAALQNTAIDSTVISAAGGIVGIAAGVSVYSLGNGVDPNSESSKQIAGDNNVGADVQGQLGDGTTNEVLGSSSDARVRSIGGSMQAAKDQLEVGNAITQSASVPAGIAASVGSATITAGGSIAIRTADTLSTSTVAGAFAGGAVGLGAGIGIVTVQTTNTAQLVGTATVTGGALTIAANSNHTLYGRSLAGSIGLAAAAQASLMLLTDNSSTHALLSGANVVTGGSVGVTANSRRSGDADASGASVALVAAVGVSWAAVNFGGTVDATLGKVGGQGVRIGSSGARAGGVTVTANSADTALASTIAASGGIGVAAVGALAETNAHVQVAAAADNATIFSSGQVLIGSGAAGHATSESTGVALSGYVAAGGSLAHALVSETVDTHVSGGTVIDAGSLTLAASVGDSGGNLVSAQATGSSGAFVGVTATEALANNASSAKVLAEASSFKATGTILVNATSTTSQYAKASGLAVGIVAIGANVARASSATDTVARLVDLIKVEGGGVRIIADGADTNTADAVSGSGGIVAGAAAEATTSSSGVTRAAIDTSSSAARYLVSALGGDVEVAATHTASFGGAVNSIQASLVGYSGATLAHAVNSTVDAHLGDYAQLRAANLKLDASNFVRNLFIGEIGSPFNSDDAGWNIDSGSGGLVNVPAGRIGVAIIQNTTATIGRSADVRLTRIGSAPPSRLEIAAHNDTVVHQKGRLDSGGAIALAEAAIDVVVGANATAAIGNAGSVLVDVGDITIAAWSDADLEARAAATTYGLAGAPSGRAAIDFTANNLASIGDNVWLEATQGLNPTDGSQPTNGTIAIAAGADLAGTAAKLRLRTTVDLYNKTAIPISTTPDAVSAVTVNSSLDIGVSDLSGSLPQGILAAGDITLRAVRGTIDATAVGTGKDIYREALAAAASAISNVFGGGDVTFDYHGGTVTKAGAGTATIDGLVLAGIQRHRLLTIDYADADVGGCTVALLDCLATPTDGEILYTTGEEEVGTTILNRLVELESLLEQYQQDPVAKGAYQSEITFLQNKLVALGLGTFDVNGKFVPGLYAGPTPAQAQALIVADNASIGAVTTNLQTATGNVVRPWITGPRDLLRDNYTDTTRGIEKQSNDVFAYLDGKITGGTDNTNAYTTQKTAITGLVTVGKSLVTQIDSTVGDNLARQATITTAANALVAAQQALAQALLDGNGTAEATARANMTTARTAIDQALDAIKANNATLKSLSAQAATNSASIKTGVDTLLTWADSRVASGDKAGIGTLRTGALAEIALRADGIGGVPDPDDSSQIVGGIQQDFAGYVSAADAYIAVLKNTTGGPGSINGDNSLAQYQDLLVALSENLAAHTAAANHPPTTPMAGTITVADTLARIANVSVFADTLGGTGSLQAPGDAKIVITNNTANTLKLGNLSIPTYDAANVRFNGVLVHNAADIDALNPQGAAAVGLTVLDGRGSSRPLVSITSNYNADSAVYFNSASALHHLNTPKMAPDIILMNGKAITNPVGAVNITSAAGNIYISGSIEAGSVSILAKNGDFVSSYVNGFDHKGGDPAAFNDPTNSAETGKGIIANGAISIAARYLNINSTIQSGIADWTLNLSGTPTLTLSAANAAGIGLTPSAVEQKITAYQNALTAAIKNKTAAPSLLINIATGVTLNMGPAGLSPTEAVQLQAAITAYLAAPTGSPVATVTIGGVSQTINIKDYISGGITGQLEFSLAKLETYIGDGGAVVSGGIYGVVSPGSNIGVGYDSANRQFVADATAVSGGFIQLYGQIINTSAGNYGKLNVLDGFGTINITNSGNIPVVLQALKTGEDPTGTLRGAQGRIEITDVTGVVLTDPTSPVVSIRKTTYTRDYVPGGGTGAIQIATELGQLDKDGNFVRVGNVGNTTGGDRTASYDPTKNLRYVWTEGTKYQQISNYTISGMTLFGSSALTVSAVANLNSVGIPSTLETGRLADGTYLSTASTLVTNTSQENNINGVFFNIDSETVSNETLAMRALVTSSYSYVTSTNLEETGRSSSCVWYTICIAQDYTYTYKLTQEYTTITTKSLKADNAIGIEFIGSNTGAINVNAASDVVLNGNVTNVGGTTTTNATGGSIITGNPAAQITSKDIKLAASGSVGGVAWGGNAAPIAVMLTGGALSASAADGNVNITSRGGLVVDQISAAGSVVAGKGSVNLVALGSITGKGTGAKIEAPRVSLTSVNGSIGSTADGLQLLVNTGYSADPSLRRFGDPLLDSTIDPNPYLGLSASAAGDIGIKSNGWSGNADGTMLLDQVLSTGGNVRLSSTGYILDNNPVETIDSRTYAELLSYWDTLGLTAGASNDDKQAAAVTAFENGITQAYRQYWQIRLLQADGGAAYDPSFTYRVGAGTAQYNALTRQFSADVLAAHPGYSDIEVASAVAQQIATFEAGQTALYHQLDAEVGTLTGSYAGAYSYVATATETAALTKGAVWTERELAFSLSPGALKTVTATNPVIKEANVSGRTVTLEAGKGVGETIGADTATPGVRIAADLDPSLLTIEQKVALAAAERSDIHLLWTHNGVTIDVPLGLDYADLTLEQQAVLDAAAAHTLPVSELTISILSKRPLNFDARTALNVTVADAPSAGDLGTANLASRTDALLGAISVQGETRIKTIGSIGNAASGAISTGNLVLESAQGGLGSTSTPLAVSLRPAATFTGRAQAGVYVNFAADARIDTVYSPGDVRLTAGGSLLNANNDRLINVLGRNVTLTATGSIGSSTQALNVGNGLGGGITATAGGLINLYGTASASFLLKAATSATAGITLTTDAEAVIDGTVSAPGTIALAGGGRWVVSGVGIVHSTAGMLDIAAGALKMLNGATMTADVGRILIRTTGDAMVTGLTAGAADGGGFAAVQIVSGGRVFGGASAARSFDIKADAAGASVSITATLGIGDKTEAGAKWQDGPGDVPGSANAITDVANPLRILTSAMALKSNLGDIEVAALSPDVTVTARAGAGSIGITAVNNFHGTLLKALLGTVGVTAGGDMTIAALGALDADLDATGALELADFGVGHSADVRAGGLMTVDTARATNGDLTFTAGGSFDGALLEALRGTVTVSAGGNITIGILRALNIDFDSGGALKLSNLEVAESATLRADDLDVSLKQVPADGPPLRLTLTGHKGGVGTRAHVVVDAPAGLVLPVLRFVDSDITTTAENVRILDAYVPGSFQLQTPLASLLYNNRTPAPQGTANAQMYAPGFGFALDLSGHHAITNAYVVRYDATAQTTEVINGVPRDGASLVRDSIRAMFHHEQSAPFAVFIVNTENEKPGDLPAGMEFVVIDGVAYPVFATGDGPAVQMSQLND